MKTKVFSILFFAAIAAIVQAQAQTLPATGNLLLPRKYSTAKTTGGQGSRLIAETILTFSDSSGAMFINDSIVYKYSGNRTGSTNVLVQPGPYFFIDSPVNTLFFDSSVDYTIPYNSASPVSHKLTTQLFDTHNNIIGDTIYNVNAAISDPTYSSLDSFAYDANNNQILSLSQVFNDTTNTWSFSEKYIYTYDGNNNLLSITFQKWKAANNAFQTDALQLFTYTGNNKLSTRIVIRLNIVTNMMDTSDKLTWTYDGNGNVINATLQAYGGNNEWVNTNKFVNTYDGNNNLITQYYYIWNVGEWIGEAVENYSNFQNGNPQTITEQGITDTGLENISSAFVTYNSYGQQTSFYQQNWIDSNADYEYVEGVPAYRLYYETYILNISQVSNTGGTAKIYPIPANDQLNIALNWDTPQASTIALYDIQGRVLRQWQVPPTTSYNNTLSVKGLAAGTYFIRINGDKGQIVQQLVVN